MKNNITNLNSHTKQDWGTALRNLHITPQSNLLNDLQKIGQTYAAAHRSTGMDTLPLYRTVLDAIAMHGSIEKTYDAYQEDIREYKGNKYVSVRKGERIVNREVREGNRSVEMLRNLAQEINFPANDLLSLTRKGPEFFSSKSPEFILADFNFDGNLTHGDR
jgi:hypothetical protein